MTVTFLILSTVYNILYLSTWLTYLQDSWTAAVLKYWKWWLMNVSWTIYCSTWCGWPLHMLTYHCLVIYTWPSSCSYTRQASTHLCEDRRLYWPGHTASSLHRHCLTFAIASRHKYSATLSVTFWACIDLIGLRDNSVTCLFKNLTFASYLLHGQLKPVDNIIQKNHLILSHAGTVVPECFKDDDASQWKSGKFDPRSLKNPQTDRHLNLHGWLRRGPLPPCKIS